MTSKYVAVSTKAVYWDGEVGYVKMPETMTVFETECRPTDTGLLDAEGRKLMRVEERQPIGYLKRG